MQISFYLSLWGFLLLLSISYLAIGILTAKIIYKYIDQDKEFFIPIFLWPAVHILGMLILIYFCFVWIFIGINSFIQGKQ